MARPAVIQNKNTEFDPEIWRPGKGMDPAKYLIFPGTVTKPGRHTPGNLRHARPYLVNGTKMFVFPTPIEGFRRSGQAQLGLRHYIGDWSVDGVTIHYEEARITLSGLFPGVTAQQNMVECINMLRSFHKGRGITLYAPGVFNHEQFVLPENWDFEHAEDDRTHSITYSITFVRLGEGPKIADPFGTPVPNNPSARTEPKGKSTRTYTTKANVRTLRAVAAAVYGDANGWPQLVTLNRNAMKMAQTGGEDSGTHKLANFRFPIGTKFRY